MKIFEIISSDTDYRGEHMSPDRIGGAPLYDLTVNGVYLDDVYSINGFTYYGSASDDRSDDVHNFNLIRGFHNKPNAKVAIYRAVPYAPSAEEDLSKLEVEMKKYMSRNIVPSWYRGKNWYDWAVDRREHLKSELGKESLDITINPGDWVTLSRLYAKNHGESALNGKYKILKKIVPAKFLFTDGNSLQEWGYHPN